VGSPSSPWSSRWWSNSWSPGAPWALSGECRPIQD
jgi:hypothetical protein